MRKQTQPAEIVELLRWIYINCGVAKIPQNQKGDNSQKNYKFDNFFHAYCAPFDFAQGDLIIISISSPGSRYRKMQNPGEIMLGSANLYQIYLEPNLLY